jgi:hypothetical protein
MASKIWVEDVGIAFAVSLLLYFVVQFSRGTGIQFVYFAF